MTRATFVALAAGGASIWMAAVADGAASPWGRPGAGDVLLLTRAETFKAEDGRRQFEQISHQTYGEVGLPGRLTAGAKLTEAWQTVTLDDAPEDDDSRSGLVEAELFVQRPVAARGNTVVALQALYAFPTSTRSLLVLDEPGAGPDAAVQAGLLAGYGKGKRFVGGLLAGRASLGEDAHQLRAEVTAGTRLSGRELLLLDMSATLSVGGASKGGADFSVVSLSGSYVFPVRERYRVQLGARQDLWGDGTDPGRSLFLSLWYER